MRTRKREKLYKGFAVMLLMAMSVAGFSGCGSARNRELTGEMALSAETMPIQAVADELRPAPAKATDAAVADELLSAPAKATDAAVADELLLASAKVSETTASDALLPVPAKMSDTMVTYELLPASEEKSDRPDTEGTETVTGGETFSVPIQNSYIPASYGAGRNAGVRNYGKSGEAGSRGIQAWDLRYMSRAEVIRMLGPIFTEDQRRSGVLASLSMAQFILESGAGTSELALNANNVFGMKVNLSGNTWEGSHWDGESKYRKRTGEQRPNGSRYGVTADFRKYSCLEECIADHSAYLVAAMNGDELRYDGLKGCLDYKKAAQIIKKGGYATSLTYTERLVLLIERWNLTQYDLRVCDIPELQQSYSNGPWEDDRSSPASNRGYKATRR